MLSESVLSHLQNLTDSHQLRLFLRDLGYSAKFDADYFLPADTKADLNAQNLLESLEVVAAHGDFAVFYGRLKGKLSLSDERLIVERLLADRNHYALFVFSDANQNCWRFLNVKRDDKTDARRRLFRRFTVDASQFIGNTTLQRLGQLDLNGQNLEPLQVQVLHDNAFNVEAVTQKFYEKYEEIFQTVKAALVPKSGLAFDEIARHDWTQRLFNRLMFLRFLERKKWLLFDGQTDYLRELWKSARDSGENFLCDRLYYAFFWGLGTPNDAALGELSREELERKRGVVPFLNGGLFTALQTYDDRDCVALSNQISGEILDFFEGFNFTIAESTPLDVEVAVDPEMLGKVFEELVTNRHGEGAYYTPRAIVSFMGREALKGYLAAKTDETPAAIEGFVDANDAANLKNSRRVLAALESVTICDPACGSGAYLLGLMQELMRLRQSVFVASELDAPSIYAQKLEIISANLYGVDKSAFAANIAMLRLWLSLVIDFDGPVEKIPALPNLGYKIGVGDSLASTPPLAQGDLFGPAYLEHAAKMGQLHDEWLRHGIEEKERRPVRPYAQIEADMKTEADAIRTGFSYKTSDDQSAAGTFDWRVGFAEVMARGGFDVVVANPPYISTKHGFAKSNKKTLQQIYVTATGQFDAYGLFVERGLMLMKPGGMLAYIIPQPVLTNSNMISVRQLLEKQTIVCLSDPGMVFDAGVEPIVIVAQKIKFSEFNDSKIKIFESDRMLRRIPLSQLKTSSGAWNMHLEEQHEDDVLLARLPRFAECFNIKRGAECGKKDESICRGGESGYPLLRGEDVEAFKVHSSNLRICRDDDEKKWKPLSLYQPGNLLIRRVTDRLTAAVDNQGHHVLNTIYVAQLKSNCSVSVEFVAAWLNSEIIRSYFSRTFVNRDKLFPYIRKEQIDALPLFMPTLSILKKVEDEVDSISRSTSPQEYLQHEAEIERLLRLALDETQLQIKE